MLPYSTLHPWVSVALLPPLLNLFNKGTDKTLCLLSTVTFQPAINLMAGPFTLSPWVRWGEELCAPPTPPCFIPTCHVAMYLTLFSLTSIYLKLSCKPYSCSRAYQLLLDQLSVLDYSCFGSKTRFTSYSFLCNILYIYYAVRLVRPLNMKINSCLKLDWTTAIKVPRPRSISLYDASLTEERSSLLTAPVPNQHYFHTAHNFHLGTRYSAK